MRSRAKVNVMLLSVTVSAVCVVGAIAAVAIEPPHEHQPNPRPGQPGHQYHEEWQGDFPTAQTANDFRVVRTMPLPDGFVGHMAFDADAERLWLISFGPPVTETPSTLYEIDPEDGRVLARSEMPFLGDLSSPAYHDGYIYQGVFHESKLYKISTDEANFGEIVKVVDLPTLEDLNLVNESHPMPFIEFGGVAVDPDGNLVIHADDVGELITLERETGEILHRARTLKALGGILAAAGQGENYYVVGNSDPRGGYCALSYPPALSRTPEQKDISWALLDGESGKVLASVRRQNSRAYASGIALLRHEDVDGAPYGQFAFLATGEEGLLELEWTPGRDAY